MLKISEFLGEFYQYSRATGIRVIARTADFSLCVYTDRIGFGEGSTASKEKRLTVSETFHFSFPCSVPAV